MGHHLFMPCDAENKVLNDRHMYRTSIKYNLYITNMSFLSNDRRHLVDMHSFYSNMEVALYKYLKTTRGNKQICIHPKLDKIFIDLCMATSDDIIIYDKRLNRISITHV